MMWHTKDDRPTELGLSSSLAARDRKLVTVARFGVLRLHTRAQKGDVDGS